MKIFISQPLFEKTYDEILKKRQLIIEKLWNEFNCCYYNVKPFVLLIIQLQLIQYYI